MFCKFLIEEKILKDNPTKGIRSQMPGKRSKIPDLPEVKNFIASLKTDSFTDRRLRVMLLLALDTGLRRGELCGLKQGDIQKEILAISVRPETSKVKRGRVVPISPQVFREIKSFAAAIPHEWRTPWLFPSNNGTQLLPENFGRQMRRAAEKTGIKLKIHGLRHLCANEFLRETGNIVLTARLLGHSNIQTTSNFYEHLNFEDLREAHNKAGVVNSIIGCPKIRKI